MLHRNILSHCLKNYREQVNELLDKMHSTGHTSVGTCIDRSYVQRTIIGLKKGDV
jgi:hypothetical protein